MRTASWIIKNKETGGVITEIWDRRLLDRLNTDKYEAVPVQEHLASLNQKSPTQLLDQPVSEQTTLKVGA